ncbi:hypothetical protein D1155_11650 [Anaerotruncus sp. 80]|uniref:Single-stranded DNA-binding protein n=1 Tax=Anaerotruncus colihominis TaxID=169435 RepID=A0A845QMA7_9FIRM|nr:MULTISPECIES: hypothetical protein [Anaerotruncus]NBH62305.1 hypothetical protein [Anaerotruncus colihominis]NCF02960.1 hypothetical protein [Anaerotruncus sp. 80]
MKIETINATVFEPKKEDGRKDTVIANISTYEGKNQNDKARYCSWRTRFVGEAYEKALGLKDKDRIVIKAGKVENNYNKEKEKLYVMVTVFDFEYEEEKS